MRQTGRCGSGKLSTLFLSHNLDLDVCLSVCLSLGRREGRGKGKGIRPELATTLFHHSPTHVTYTMCPHPTHTGFMSLLASHGLRYLTRGFIQGSKGLSLRADRIAVFFEEGSDFPLAYLLPTSPSPSKYTDISLSSPVWPSPPLFRPVSSELNPSVEFQWVPFCLVQHRPLLDIILKQIRKLGGGVHFYQNIHTVLNDEPMAPFQ